MGAGLKRKYALASLLLLASCGKPQGTTMQAAQHKWKSPTEFGPLMLGMTYDEALRALPEAQWNSSAQQDCDADLPIKGCFLTQYQSPFGFRIDGVLLEPQLSFNKHGLLTDIGLHYEHDGIKGEDCRMIYGRMVDYVRETYGPLAYETRNPEKGSQLRIERSPEGTNYPVSGDRSSFIAGPVRGSLDGVKLPISRPTTKWNDLPYPDVFGAFLGQVGNKCIVDVSLSQPESVERRDMTDGLSALNK